MLVTLDGNSLNDTFSTDSTLQSIINDVRDAHLGTRIVVAVTVDGRQLMDDDLSLRLNQPVENAEHIDLASAEPGELVAAAYRQIASQMDKISDEHEAIADQLQSNDSSQAIRRFNDLLQVWPTCHRSILEGSAMLSLDMTALAVDDKPVRQHLDVLADKLREIRDAFQANDLVLLSDMFRYEMPDACRNWRNILNQLADQCDPAHAAS